MDLGTWLDGEYKIISQTQQNERDDEVDTNPTSPKKNNLYPDNKM